MPNHLSVLGIIHTAFSIIALFVALYALTRDGKIVPMSGPGKLYILLTIITCLTSFPIMKTGHFTGAHGLGVTVLVLLPLGVYARSFKLLGKFADYLQVLIMSTTLFLSFIPAVVETLTRLPISQPLAADPNAPIVKMGLMTLIALYSVGVIYQLIKLRSQKKTAPPPNTTVTLS
jgi:hypothetical protein